ncbi:MAG TPA: SDR family NAD(P)-dependent oxidoreductase, partial [Myxococcaceae bacterium]|nr:SDR family NAD(P)-dependent oxidoreductase [Myxococcaceae bacterium]
MTPLADRVALVTGASRGIGRAICLALAEAGATLVGTATSEAGAESTCREVRKLGRRALALAGDVSVAADADRWVAEAERAFGRIDVLVNNAGIVRRIRTVQMTDDDFDRVVKVNLNGPFYLARRVLPGMLERKWGRILNVSSISGTVGTAGSTGYCASKWGLNGLTEALAEEVRGSGVVVAAILPGSVKTDMLEGSGYEPVLSPAEVAQTVRFLCAEAPSAINGSL